MNVSPVEHRQSAQTFSNDIVNFTFNSTGHSLVRWLYTNPSQCILVEFILGSPPAECKTSKAERA